MNGTTKKDTRLKVDFNLLMSGTWVLEKKGRQRIHYFEKGINGGKIVIYNALDVPTPTDSKLLDYLMLKSQKNDWSQEIVIPSISQIINDLGLRRGKETVKRIKKSLKILRNTSIEFHNCFIDNGVLKHFKQGNWQLITIGIVAKYGFEPVKGRGNPVQVKVVFDDDFISLCKHSLSYKLITYAPIRGLRDTPYALYKWAYRWYDAKKGYGERWIGDGKSLVKWYKNELNSTANYKYPSDVLRVVNSAIKQLNDNKSKVPFSLELKNENGKYKLTMRAKGCVIKIKAKQSPYDNLPESDRNNLLNYVEENMKHIKNPCGFLRSLPKRGLDMLVRKMRGKKALVSAGKKPAETTPEQAPKITVAKQPKEHKRRQSPLENRVAKVLEIYGLGSEDFVCVPGPGDEYFVYMPGLESGKVEELNANVRFITALTKVTGKPVRIA